MILKRGIIVPLLILVLMLGVLTLTTACWGDPSFKIFFENKSESTITIYVNDYKVGNVNPGEQTTSNDIPMTLTKFRIEAKNSQEEIIFSQTLTREQMQRIDNKRIWKVVIPPLEN